jgi:hypothetical protein
MWTIHVLPAINSKLILISMSLFGTVYLVAGVPLCRGGVMCFLAAPLVHGVLWHAVGLSSTPWVCSVLVTIF